MMKVGRATAMPGKTPAVLTENFAAVCFTALS
jgi:hypothetical protein